MCFLKLGFYHRIVVSFYILVDCFWSKLVFYALFSPEFFRNITEYNPDEIVAFILPWKNSYVGCFMKKMMAKASQYYGGADVVDRLANSENCNTALRPISMC